MCVCVCVGGGGGGGLGVGKVLETCRGNEVQEGLRISKQGALPRLSS